MYSRTVYYLQSFNCSNCCFAAAAHAAGGEDLLHLYLNLLQQARKKSYQAWMKHRCMSQLLGGLLQRARIRTP